MAGGADAPAVLKMPRCPGHGTTLRQCDGVWFGPTEQFRRLELARLAWALSRCAEPEVGAA